MCGGNLFGWFAKLGMIHRRCLQRVIRLEKYAVFFDLLTYVRALWSNIDQFMNVCKLKTLRTSQRCSVFLLLVASCSDVVHCSHKTNYLGANKNHEITEWWNTFVYNPTCFNRTAKFEQRHPYQQLCCSSWMKKQPHQLIRYPAQLLRT